MILKDQAECEWCGRKLLKGEDVLSVGSQLACSVICFQALLFDEETNGV